MLTFAYTLPTYYLEQPQAHPGSDTTPQPIKRSLPPTYAVSFDGVPGLRAQVKYMIKVELVKKRLWKRKYT
jgi:hypothetical protein